MGIPIPKVTKTTIDPYTDVSIFEDSSTLLTIQERRLFISFDNGVNWEKSEEIPVDIWKVEIDETYRNSRAVATGRDEPYLTEDQGKHWRKLNLPKSTGYKLDTHPFEKDYLLAHCLYNDTSYVSNDGGKNFREIELPNTSYWHSLTCEFACKSRNSIFPPNKDLIYCLDGGMPGGRVFYTDDFGKSINSIDQFKDYTILDFRILDSRILVFTTEDKFHGWSTDECSTDDWSTGECSTDEGSTDEFPTNDLWVSSDGITFDKAFFPAVLRNPDTDNTIEDGLGRIIIPTTSFLCEEQASLIFISDSSGLQFRLLDIGAEDTLVSSSFKTSKTSKGTMLAHLTFKHPDRRGYSSHNKISFDYGDTWSNVKDNTFS